MCCPCAVLALTVCWPFAGLSLSFRWPLNVLSLSFRCLLAALSLTFAGRSLDDQHEDPSQPARVWRGAEGVCPDPSSLLPPPGPRSHPLFSSTFHSPPSTLWRPLSLYAAHSLHTPRFVAPQVREVPDFCGTSEAAGPQTVSRRTEEMDSPV